MIDRVRATGAARALIAVLENRYGPLILRVFESESASLPVLCHSSYDAPITQGDALIGDIWGAHIYAARSLVMSVPHFEIKIDVARGRAAQPSLEAIEGVRFEGQRSGAGRSPLDGESHVPKPIDIDRAVSVMIRKFGDAACTVALSRMDYCTAHGSCRLASDWQRVAATIAALKCCEVPRLRN